MDERLCPVCGYEHPRPTWHGGVPSFEICPCCGIQYGYSDAAGGDEAARAMLYRRWRQAWIEGGMRFKWPERQPKDWEPVAQLQRIGVHLEP